MLTLPPLCSTMFCDYYSLFKAILNKVYLYCTVNCIVSSFQKHSDLITMPGAGTDIQDWFRSLPFFTKYWFGGSVLFTLLGRFNLVNPYWLVLTWDTFITKYEVTIPLFPRPNSFISSGFTSGARSLRFSSTNQVSTGWSTFISSTTTGKEGSQDPGQSLS